MTRILLLALAAPLLLAMQALPAPGANPADDWLDFETRKKNGWPIGVMHHSLEGVALPPQGATLDMVCSVVRADGTINRCDSGSGGEASLIAAAARRMRTMRMDVTGIDPADPSPLRTRATVILKLEDRLHLYAPVAIDETARPIWLARPEPRFIDHLYPDRALTIEREGILHAQCQIQRDGSLVCPGLQVWPARFGFERSGLDVISHYRAAPALADGRRSRGVWIQLTVRFDIPD